MDTSAFNSQGGTIVNSSALILQGGTIVKASALILQGGTLENKCGRNKCGHVRTYFARGDHCKISADGISADSQEFNFLEY